MEYQTLGECLLDARKEKGWPRRIIAQKKGISECTLMNYEFNTAYPSDEKLEALCDLYGLPYTDLKERFPKPKRKTKPRTKGSQTELSEYLVNARLKKNLFQKDVAEKIGRSYMLVSAWESGRLVPAAEYLPKIAEIYGVDFEEFYNLWKEQSKVETKEYTTLAAKLRRARVNAMMTQEQARKFIGLSANILTQYEQGRKMPSDTVLAIMADVYNDESLKPKQAKKKSYMGQADFREKLEELKQSYPANLILSLFPEATLETINIDAFEEVLSGMSPRVQSILLKRYKYGMTLEEVGREFNITRERIRQLEKGALRKLKRCNEFVVPAMCEGCSISAINDESNRIQQSKSDAKLLLSDLIGQLNDINEALGSGAIKKTETSIESLHFSNRTYNCLKREGVDTLRELSQLSQKDLMHMKNLGMKSFNEVVDKLSDYGISLRWS